LGGGAVDDELDGAGAHVVHGPGGGDRGLPETLALGRGEGGSGRLLDHLLVAPLQGALALPKVDHVPVGVGEDLQLDLAGRGGQPVDDEGVVAEGAGGLPARGGERGGEVLGPHDLVHPLAAPAGGRFDQHGEAEIGGPGEEGGVVRPGRGQSGHDGYAAGGDGGAGGDLVPHR